MLSNMQHVNEFLIDTGNKEADTGLIMGHAFRLDSKEFSKPDGGQALINVGELYWYRLESWRRPTCSGREAEVDVYGRRYFDWPSIK